MPFPQKKPGLSMILGIGGPKPKSEAPPPAYGGANDAPDPDAATEGAEGGDGMCSTTCPKCGESYQLQVTPMPDANAGAEGAEAPPDMEAAG